MTWLIALVLPTWHMLSATTLPSWESGGQALSGPVAVSSSAPPQGFPASSPLTDGLSDGSGHAMGTVGAKSVLGGWESRMRAFVPASPVHSLPVVCCWDAQPHRRPARECLHLGVLPLWPCGTHLAQCPSPALPVHGGLGRLSLVSKDNCQPCVLTAPALGLSGRARVEFLPKVCTSFTRIRGSLGLLKRRY